MEKSWYQKKRYLIPLTLAGVALAVSATSTTPLTTGITDQSATVYQATQQPVTSLVTPTVTSLSNDNHYSNVNGNTIHSPAYSNTNAVPSGASAQCGDGTYSFSQNHRGTCSHHGGVSQWLN